MRKTSHFGRALYVARRHHELTLDALAQRCGLSQPGINRIENYARRPDVDTLRALCGCWPDPITAARVLVEHLRDEVERAGHADGSITIHPTTGAAAEAAAVHALALIHDRSPEVAAHLDALLADLARLVASEPAAAREIMRAAEPPAPEYAAKPHEQRAKRTRK